ncbi:hypothetical protein EDD16DRAFT_1668134, partial [Pisolithus croceorrhizus]
VGTDFHFANEHRSRTGLLMPSLVFFFACCSSSLLPFETIPTYNAPHPRCPWFCYRVAVQRHHRCARAQILHTI